MTRLTWQTVNAIRDAYIPGLVPCSVLASTYHVGRSTIFDVVSGRTWKAPAAQTPPEPTGRLQSDATEHSQAVNHLHATTALVESPDGAASTAGHVPNRCYTKSVNTIQNSQKGEHINIMGRVTYRTTSQAGHDPDQVALLMDVTGKCSGCMKHVTARLVAYYSGEILVRCGSCQQTTVQVDAEYWTAAKIFPPWQEDSTDTPPDLPPGRYTHGLR